MFHEIPYVDPLRAFAPWSDEPWAMLLDSGGTDLERGRHAFLAVRPVHTLVADAEGVRRDGCSLPLDPLTALQNELAGFPALAPGPLPFAGGAVGLFGYELGRHLERAPVRHGSGPAELAVGFYDAIAGFDRVARRAWVTAARSGAEAKAAALARTIAAAPPLPPLSSPPGLRLEPELTPEAYRDRVRQILALIAAGEVYQVNFTQRFLAPRPPGLDPFALYRRLRALNPAPFAACLRLEGPLAVLSASPERFLSLDRAGRIEARPIKGTRPRAADPTADQAAAAALAASSKDQAENLMITDLLRNDIGRVAAFGSVRVPCLRGIESHATVHHLVSVVEGQLRPGLGPVDLLRASFPGGSITGAPKVRAMEIIDDLEPGPRGPYCGAIGWIGGDGAMDTSIVIRALTLTADTVIAQAGGGIVAESDPDAEQAEMMTKLAPALAALIGETACRVG